MALKQWLIMLVPILIIIPVFINFSIINKDPNQLLDASYNKMNSLTAYLITADVIMDLSMMDSSMSYYSNTTTALSNGRTYIKMVTLEPFTNVEYTTEQFILETGNFTCTDSYGPGVCFYDNVSLPIFDQAVATDDYFSISFIGSKKVNNQYCDIVLSSINTTKLQDLMYGLENDLSNVNTLYTYSCIDPVSGLILESLLSVKGETNYMGLLIDVGINITKNINSFSKEVPESLFILPYNIISPLDLEILINNTLINESLY